MIDPLTAGIGAGSSLIGGLMQMSSVNKTNAANAAIAQAQMEFQERMSSTAHQREVKDLKAAGLNPILSATGGSGASTPGGAGATMIAQDFGSSAKAIGDSALEWGKMPDALKNVVADTATKVESAKNLAVQTESSAKDVERKGIENSFSAAMLGEQLKKMSSDATRAGIDTDLAYQSFADSLKAVKADAARKVVGVDRDKQALKYDYMTDKYMESMGLAPSSAKRQGEGSIMQSIYDAKDLTSLGVRKFLGR